jgi:hypothetical protein
MTSRQDSIRRPSAVHEPQRDRVSASRTGGAGRPSRAAWRAVARAASARASWIRNARRRAATRSAGPPTASRPPVTRTPRPASAAMRSGTSRSGRTAPGTTGARAGSSARTRRSHPARSARKRLASAVPQLVGSVSVTVPSTRETRKVSRPVGP